MIYPKSNIRKCFTLVYSTCHTPQLFIASLVRKTYRFYRSRVFLFIVTMEISIACAKKKYILPNLNVFPITGVIFTGSIKERLVKSRLKMVQGKRTFSDTPYACKLFLMIYVFLCSSFHNSMIDTCSWAKNYIMLVTTEPQL